MVGIAIAVEMADGDVSGRTGQGLVFLTVPDGYDPDGIVVGCLQTRHIGTVIAAVAAYQLVVDTSIVVVLTALDVDVIAVGSLHLLPFGVE